MPKNEHDRAASPPVHLPRRDFLTLTGGGLVASALPLAAAGCKRPDGASGGDAQAPHSATLVRVASVKTAVEGNVLPELIAEFERLTAYRVKLSVGEDIYDWAREGRVDQVISHYGHRDAEAFVLDGFGEWPRTIFSNQMALVGPPDDPAKVRGLDDAGEAFRRIAATKSTFVLNDIEGIRYLTEILWNAAGKPDRAGWFVDEQHKKDDAILVASKLGGYSFWGLTPFLRVKAQLPLQLEPLVLADPLLQRMLVSILVKPAKVAAVNEAGARALEAFLLAPATQARIRTTRYPGETRVCWVPAGRHNRTAILPKG